jgi:hypothetical protein
MRLNISAIIAAPRRKTWIDYERQNIIINSEAKLIDGWQCSYLARTNSVLHAQSQIVLAAHYLHWALSTIPKSLFRLQGSLYRAQIRPTTIPWLVSFKKPKNDRKFGHWRSPRPITVFRSSCGQETTFGCSETTPLLC